MSTPTDAGRRSGQMHNAYDPARVNDLPEGDRALIARRDAALGAAYRLFYQRPFHPVRAEGVWMWDAEGNRFLDAYNNVACVGHCHPRVVEALARVGAKFPPEARVETLPVAGQQLTAIARSLTMDAKIMAATGRAVFGASGAY